MILKLSLIPVIIIALFGSIIGISLVVLGAICSFIHLNTFQSLIGQACIDFGKRLEKFVYSIDEMFVQTDSKYKNEYLVTLIACHLSIFLLFNQVILPVSQFYYYVTR